MYSRPSPETWTGCGARVGKHQAWGLGIPARGVGYTGLDPETGKEGGREKKNKERRKREKDIERQQKHRQREREREKER